MLSQRPVITSTLNSCHFWVPSLFRCLYLWLLRRLSWIPCRWLFTNRFRRRTRHDSVWVMAWHQRHWSSIELTLCQQFKICLSVQHLWRWLSIETILGQQLNASSVLVHRLRRWPSTEAALCQHLWSNTYVDWRSIGLTMTHCLINAGPTWQTVGQH